MAKVLGLGRDCADRSQHRVAICRRQSPPGQEYGVAVLPGMEISSKEDVHILGYFPSLEAALGAGEEVYAHLPNVRNEPSLFGNQLDRSGRKIRRSVRWKSCSSMRLT